MAEFRSSDPYRPLLSLADQKTLDVAENLVRKKSVQNASPLVTPESELAAARARLRGDMHHGQSSNLIDIAQSSVDTGYEVLKDFVTDETRPIEEIRAESDLLRGVTPEARERFVTGPTQEVMKSTAAASLALDEGRYFDALKQGGKAALQGLKAGPGLLADSANVVPEAIAGAALTAVGTPVGGAILGRRVKKGSDALERFKAGVSNMKKKMTRGQMFKEAVKTLPKTAAQMSVVTAGMTQRMVADWEIEHGEEASFERKAAFFVGSLATMTGQGAIIKNLFVPNFKKEFVKEAKAAVATLKGTSSLKNVGRRVGEGLKKAFIAGGAEGGQEYAQTWVEIIGTSIGPDKGFLEGLKEATSDGDNQVEAAASIFLGAGAGATARTATAAPALVAGTAVDTAVGTVKTTAKVVGATAQKAGRVAQKLNNISAYTFLSKEERKQVQGAHESRKAVADVTIAKFDAAIETIDKANTFADLVDSDVKGFAQKIQRDNEITDQQMADPDVFSAFKDKLSRKIKADKKVIDLTVEGSHAADIAVQSGKNITSKSVETAKAAMKAVDPGLQAVIKTIGKVSKEATKAVKELRSSTAYGMLELAGNAGTAEIKQIVEASKSLSMDDLNRVTGIMSEIRPDIAKKLEPIKRQKEKILKKTGIKRTDIINEENLSPIIKDVADRGGFDASEAARVSVEVDQATASNIEDLESLSAIEKAVDAIENSASFKNQVDKVMSRNNMVIIRRKLERKRVELEKDPDLKDKAKKAAKKAAKAAKETAGTVGTAAAESIAAAAAPDLKLSDKFRETVQVTEDAIKQAGDKINLVESAPAFVAKMKENGIETRSDFLKFVKTFPGLEQNVPFFKELDNAYETNISANEVYDNLATRGGAAVEAVKKFFNDSTEKVCNV